MASEKLKLVEATFQRSRGAAAKALVAYVNKSLAVREGAKNDDILLIAIRGLGKLQQNTAFLPLLQLINSDVPTKIKREAKTAINKLKWGKKTKVKRASDLR